MLHPDYQYSPQLVTAMAAMIASGHYDASFASRILGRGALAGGMPLYKYVFNRLLTLFQNIADEPETVGISYRLSRMAPLGAREAALARLLGRFRVRQPDDRPDRRGSASHIGEISCPTKYFPEASSINFRRSCIYGLGVLRTSIDYRLCRWGLKRSPLFVAAAEKRLPVGVPLRELPGIIATRMEQRSAA